MSRPALLAVLSVAAIVSAVGCSNDEKSEEHASHDTTVAESGGVIDGVELEEYPAGSHVGATQRVAYDQSPPFGGPHDQVWATCTGVVYPEAIRTENVVHSLEHGAVWIAYNPDQISGAVLDSLAERVDGTPYLLMSPYPGLDVPISLQAWGARLKLESADDPRVDRFITEYRASKNAPEPGASCASVPRLFDPDNPPAFDPSPPPADAVPVR